VEQSGEQVELETRQIGCWHLWSRSGQKRPSGFARRVMPRVFDRTHTIGQTLDGRLKGHTHVSVPLVGTKRSKKPQLV
jgi:hypothetical protein